MGLEYSFTACDGNEFLAKKKKKKAALNPKTSPPRCHLYEKWAPKKAVLSVGSQN